MSTPELIRWSLVSGLAAALLRRTGPGSPFWALASVGPFVVTRQRRSTAGRFRVATPT